jgi:hypothetical protein
MADEAQPAAPSAPTATTPAAPTDGSQQPPAAAASSAAAPEPKPISTEDAVSAIEGETDIGKLSDLLDAPKKPPQKKAPEPSSATPAAPAPTPAAPEPTPSGAQAPSPSSAAPPAEPGEDEVIEGEEKLPKNFRFHTEDKQRSRYLKLLRQRPEANPIELAREAGYTLPTESTPAAPAAPTPPVDTLQPLRKEIEDLKAKKKTHREAYEFDKVDEINETILEKTLELQRKETEIADEQAFETEYRETFAEARSEAVRMYPDTGKKDTAQFEELSRERSYLEVHEPGFFDDPNYPLALIERLEKRRPDLFRGAAPAAPTPPAPVPPATPAAPTSTPPNAASPNKAARPVGAVEPATSGSTTPLTKEETVKKIEEMSPEELEALGDKIGTKNVRAGKRTPGVIRGG